MDELSTELEQDGRRGGPLLIGLSHRTAPVEVRERCSVAPVELPARLESALGVEGVDEAWILSTCNRTELLVWGRVDVGRVLALRERLFSHAAEDELYTYRGVEALCHVYRVASGLDSLVLGESQILSQLKVALAAGEECGAVGRELRPLLTQAIRVGKRVRTETKLGQGSLSVAKVGVDLAGHVFNGFEKLQALIVGTGETGLLVAKHLKSRGIGQLVFANRTLENANAAAEEFGGLACGFDELAAQLERSDLVVACVDAGRHIVTSDIVRQARLHRRDRPVLAIDLSVPRAIDPSIARFEPVLYYDLDDLAKVVEQNRDLRADSSEETSSILVSEVHKYLSQREFAAAAPVVSEMRERFDAVREKVLDDLAGADSAPEQIQLAHELTRRLLDQAFQSFKDTIRRRRSPEDLESAYRRFLDRL